MSICKWCNSKVECIEPPKSLNNWKRLQCNKCYAMELYSPNGKIQTKDLDKLYEIAWQEEGESGVYATGSTTQKIAKSIVTLSKVSNLENPKCLDYGGGHGALAKELARGGIQGVTVFEPYGKKADIEGVLWVDSLDYLGPEEKFDVIFMIEVIEHLLDPINELKRIKSLLSKGGKIIITTPNTRGWRARIGKGMWREAQNPTHINLFSPKSLKLCLKESGFDSISRSFSPLPFHTKGLIKAFLFVTQIFGIDGGIRITAINNE